MAIRSVASAHNDKLAAEVAKLVKMRLLVGIPGETIHPGSKVTNSVIGYLLNFGDDEMHIPPRPFLEPGIDSVRGEIAAQLVAGVAAVTVGATAAQGSKSLSRAGEVAVKAVQKKMTDGPFAPLSARTIAARAKRGRKGAKQYMKLLKQGVPADVLNDTGMDFVRPLIDTGALRKVTYVIDKG